MTSVIREPAGTPALIDPVRTLHVAALVNIKQNVTAKKKPKQNKNSLSLLQQSQEGKEAPELQTNRDNINRE